MQKIIFIIEKIYKNTSSAQLWSWTGQDVLNA